MDKKQQYRLGIVIDTTLSFSVVYPQIYYMIERMLMGIGEAKKNKMNQADIKYGITLIGDNMDSIMFENGTYFTGDEEEVFQKLQSLEFSGGSRNGRENITAAINQQLYHLNHGFDSRNIQDIHQGLLVLSDSLPEDENDYPDFTSNEPGIYGDYKNRGLRFAYIFTYSDKYMPQMRIVDYKGSLTENTQNTCIYSSLSVLLQDDEESSVNFAEKIVEEIFERYACT